MTTTRHEVSFLGLGEMGPALARAVIAAGHPTTVWNRSPDKATTLAARGARAAQTAGEAVDAADLIVVCCSTSARYTRSLTRWPAGSPAPRPQPDHHIAGRSPRTIALGREHRRRLPRRRHHGDPGDDRFAGIRCSLQRLAGPRRVPHAAPVVGPRRILRRGRRDGVAVGPGAAVRDVRDVRGVLSRGGAGRSGGGERPRSSRRAPFPGCRRWPAR